MGRRARARGRVEKLEAPETSYETAAGTLVLRGVLSAGTRRAYASLSGTAASNAEDLWHRRAEFLFERLAARWIVDGVEWSGHKDLLARYRIASVEERDAVRGALREHLAEWFPDVPAP